MKWNPFPRALLFFFLELLLGCGRSRPWARHAWPWHGAAANMLFARGGTPSPPCVHLQIVLTWTFFPSEVPTSTSPSSIRLSVLYFWILGLRCVDTGANRVFVPLFFHRRRNTVLVCTFSLGFIPFEAAMVNTLQGQRKRSTSDRSIFVCCARLFLPPYERTTTTWYVRGLQLQAVHTV